MFKQDQHNRNSSIRFGLIGALLLLVAAAAPLPERHLKERDHKSLGKLIGVYFEAKAESSGISAAREKLDSAILKIEKKSKGLPLLSMVEDLEQALYFSRKYKDGVTKGRAASKSFDNAFPDLGEIEYVIHAPKGYKASKGPFPLILCFPDAGEDPETHLEQDWLDSDVRGSAIFAICKLPENQESWNLLRGGVGNAMQILRNVKAVYAVDVDRIYIAGRGKSVDTAMCLASIFPHVFAGVVGRAGDMGETSPTNFRNLPTLFAGGGANCTAFQESAKEAGIENCQIQADATEADIWKWMEETRRDAHPSDVSIAPANNTGRTAYWVEVEGFDPTEGPTLRATIDRAANSIEVKGTGIASVRLYFNDTLLDLDKKIHVNVNGVKHELSLPRRLDMALDQAFNSGDGGRAYVNSHFFDLAANE